LYKALIMNDSKEVEVLLKNIQQGIRLYGVKELNDAITKELYKKNNKSEEVDYIMTLVSEHYKITRQSLIKSKQHNIQKSRQMAYCLLYFDLKMTMRQIANIFDKYVRSIAIAIEYYRKLNPELNIDKLFIDEYKYFQQKLLIYINSKK